MIVLNALPCNKHSYHNTHTDSVQGKTVAIKCMKRIFDEPTDAKRSYREMHILRHLKHPSIVSLINVHSTIIDDKYYEAAVNSSEAATELNVYELLTKIPRSLGDLYLVSVHDVHCD